MRLIVRMIKTSVTVPFESADLIAAAEQEEQK